MNNYICNNKVIIWKKILYIYIYYNQCNFSVPCENYFLLCTMSLVMKMEKKK